MAAPENHVLPVAEEEDGNDDDNESYDSVEEYSSDESMDEEDSPDQISSSSESDISSETEQSQGEDFEDSFDEDAPLALLPREALLVVCSYLESPDLVRLHCEKRSRVGWVCSRLRDVSRSEAAWEHVEYPNTEYPPHGWRQSGELRIAPALRSLTLSYYTWPPFNLAQCTRRVREFELVWGMNWEQSYDVDKIGRLLRLYRGHLQVVKLGCMQSRGAQAEMRLLRVIDRLGVQELYVAGRLLKAYGGRAVTELAAGAEVGQHVLADALASARRTLTAFRVDPNLDWNNWAVRSRPVERALRKCKKLEELRVPWGRSVALLDGFPCLRSLTLLHLGPTKQHVAVKRFFKTSTATRQLERLTVHFNLFACRGLTRAVAAGCPNVRHLTLVYRGLGSMTCIRTDVPRDLHAILGAMGDLESLVLVRARVPGSVLNAMADGALPNLTLLHLKLCSVTKKGRSARTRLQSARPDLKMVVNHLSSAFREPTPPFSWRYDISRCSRSMCRAASDCEEEDDDPVLDEGEDWGCEESFMLGY